MEIGGEEGPADAGTVAEWQCGYEGRAVEVQCRQSNRDGVNTGKRGLGWSCRVVWLKGAMAPKLVASKHLRSNGSRLSPKSK
jgi:hypothetical protein